jgi:hypothetical protein
MERRRIADVVAKLATAIAAGEMIPEPAELHALAAVCDHHHLPAEAARVRRWMHAPPDASAGEAAPS